MGLVLWIDQNTFATSLLEKVFKSKNLPFYTLDHGRDFLFLVKDLKPEVLVLEENTILTDQELVLKQLSDMPGLPIIVVGSEDKLNLGKPVFGKITVPFDPFLIPDQISSILAGK